MAEATATNPIEGVTDVDSASSAILGLMESQDQPETEIDEAPVEQEVEIEAESDEEVEIEAESDSEVEAQAEAEEVEIEEEVEEEPLYAVKIDGEDVEVNLDELRSGYQRQSDYTKKSQALSEQRKQIEADLQATQAERAQYAQALEYFNQNVTSEMAKYENVNWQELKESDPYEYMMRKEEYRELQDKQKASQEAQTLLQQRQQAEQQQQMQEIMQRESKLLSEALPEYANPDSTIRDDLKKYAVGMGYSDQEINGLVDHRAVLMLNKAMQFDRLQKAKKTVVKKKVKNVPKVQKPGSAQTKQDVASEARSAKVKRLRSSGKIDDAASAIFDML